MQRPGARLHPRPLLGTVDALLNLLGRRGGAAGTAHSAPNPLDCRAGGSAAGGCRGIGRLSVVASSPTARSWGEQLERGPTAPRLERSFSAPLRRAVSQAAPAALCRERPVLPTRLAVEPPLLPARGRRATAAAGCSPHKPLQLSAQPGSKCELLFQNSLHTQRLLAHLPTMRPLCSGRLAAMRRGAFLLLVLLALAATAAAQRDCYGAMVSHAHPASVSCRALAGVPQ